MGFDPSKGATNVGQEDQSVGWNEALGGEASFPETPRTSGDTIFALGREWKVSSCENRIKAQFEMWVQSRAKQSYSGEDNPEEACLMRAAYIADYGAGHYRWDGRYCRSARGDLPGIRQLLYLLLKRCQAKVTEEEAGDIFREDPAQAAQAIRWALGNSHPPSPKGERTQTEDATPQPRDHTPNHLHPRKTPRTIDQD